MDSPELCAGALQLDASELKKLELDVEFDAEASLIIAPTTIPPTKEAAFSIDCTGFEKNEVDSPEPCGVLETALALELLEASELKPTALETVSAPLIIAPTAMPPTNAAAFSID